MVLLNKTKGINKTKIVFKCFNGKSYSGNPKSISEELYKEHLNFEIVWVFKNPIKKQEIVPSYVKCVKANSFGELKEWATAKFWIDNTVKPSYYYKSRKQVYIQTWHGDRGFKKILHDNKNKTYKLKENEICDLILVGSEYGLKKFKGGMKYDKQFMKFGCPRNDMLVQKSEAKIKKMRSELKIPVDVKVLLFAPTFRERVYNKQGEQMVDDIDLEEVLNHLEDQTNKRWICFVRSHSSVQGLAGIPTDHEDFRDLSSYENMNDLLLVSDFLITDYSSSAGDFALMEKPIILFQNDREIYLENDRSFYFDIKESPYWVAKNQNELIELIENINPKKAKRNCNDILDFYETIETGKATKKVCQYIVSKV